MAKTFKDYDKEFAHLRGTALKTIEQAWGRVCRVDNYIGALVRGGCLKPNTYEVIK